MKITLSDLNEGFAGGSTIKLQIHNGLFDGATYTMTRAYMINANDTTTLGTDRIIFVAVASIAGLDLDGLEGFNRVAKGKNNLLEQNVPA